jgi:hypothetical protein
MKQTIQLAALSLILCGTMLGCRPEKRTLGPNPVKRKAFPIPDGFYLG